MGFDFDAAVQAPFRMQPGLRRLAPGARQLRPNLPGDRTLSEKLAVLSTDWGRALLQAEGFDAAPALTALSRHAAAEHPEAWRCDGGDPGALRLGWALHQDQPVALTESAPAEVGACLRALPAQWRFAGLLALAFAEDFAIVDATSGSIPWLAVCLPSHWSPEEKVGRPFAEVHAPVADNVLIVKAADHLMRLVSGDERWERFVWTITSHPRLNAHPREIAAARWPTEASVDELAAQAFWRTEQQTFIPLPERRQAVFTIGVELQPLAAAIDTPARAARLHAALSTMSPAVLDYRSLAAAQPRLLAWLAARAAA